MSGGKDAHLRPLKRKYRSAYATSQGDLGRNERGVEITTGLETLRSNGEMGLSNRRGRRSEKPILFRRGRLQEGETEKPVYNETL